MKISRKYTTELYFYLVNDTTLQFNYPLHFGRELLKQI